MSLCGVPRLVSLVPRSVPHFHFCSLASSSVARVSSSFATPCRSLTGSLVVHPRGLSIPLLSSFGSWSPPSCMKRSYSQMAFDSKVHKVIIVGSGPRLVPLLSYIEKLLAECFLASPVVTPPPSMLPGLTFSLFSLRDSSLEELLLVSLLSVVPNQHYSQQCESHFGFYLVQVASSPPPPILRTSPGSLMASWAPRSWRT